MAISWTSTETQKPFLCLNLTRNQQKKNQAKHFPMDYEWNIGDFSRYRFKEVFITIEKSVNVTIVS